VQIDLFTTRMRDEFLKGTIAVPPREPAWKTFTLEVGSEARFEDYGWMTPSPGIQRYEGHRRYSTVDLTQYIVPNLEFDAGMRVPLRNIRDDKVGGYPIRFRELGEKATAFPGRYVLQQLNLGESTVCFDGSNFFAKAHNQGSGSPGSSLPAPFDTANGGLNLLPYTSANTADGLTYRMAFLLHYNTIKPLGYQLRHGPELGTNSGNDESRENKEVRFWIDLEAAAFYGWWWDAVLVKITNTPSLQDMFVCIDQVQKQFRSFTFPAAMPTDPALYVHQDLQFSPEVGTVVCSTGLEALLNHALNEERIGFPLSGSAGTLTNNIYAHKWNLVATGYLNSAAGT
jgi:phage major head subunit gpT-like protein